jgi:Restriction endonuclease NaeI
VRRKRNRFQEWPAAAARVKLPPIGPGETSPEPDVVGVAQWFRSLDATGDVMAEVIRDSLDIVLDGQRTGRWCYGHLTKTEKTHLGTVIEIELQKEYGISDEGPLDYAIAGVPVDCKYSADFGKWQIPREMYRRNEDGLDIGDDHLALLVWAEERSRQWRAGLIRITETLLQGGRNQDKKRTLRPDAFPKIHWIWPDPPPMPENTLVELPEWDRAAIFSYPRSGQARINELLRRVQLRTIRRTVILTVAQQDDALKRPRDAREHLRPDGILVFGHEKAHRQIAERLGLDAVATVDHLPEKGEFLAARVVPAGGASGQRSAFIEGASWRLAVPGDPVIAGPRLPRKAS